MYTYIYMYMYIRICLHMRQVYVSYTHMNGVSCAACALAPCARALSTYASPRYAYYAY